MGETDDANQCYLCLGHRDDEDGGVDADGYGYHSNCELRREGRIHAGKCWACNEPIKEGDDVSDNAHSACLDQYGHGEYVGF